MSQTILCSTDFSPASTNAAGVAALLASRLKGSVDLVHVASGLDYGDALVTQYMEDAIKQRLHKEAEKIRERGVNVEEKLLQGSVYQELSKAANATNPFVVVMASQPKTNVFERWLIGSATERVVQSISTPTLVVRDAQFLEDWLSGRETLRILVATNLSPDSNAALSWVSKLAHIGPCELTVAYLNWIPDESLRLGIKEDFSFSSNPEKLQEFLERDMREKVGKILGDLPFKLVIAPRWGRTDVPLIHLAERNRIHLLVVGSRRSRSKGLLDESISRGLLHRSPLNIAIVPTHAVPIAETPLGQPRKILVATDFSDEANHAIPHAYSLLSPGGVVRLIYMRNEAEKREVSELIAQLHALIPIEASARGIETETDILGHGDPAEKISQSAAQFGADLICLGRPHRSHLARGIFGSVSEGVIARMDRPVLLVPKAV